MSTEFQLEDTLVPLGESTVRQTGQSNSKTMTLPPAVTIPVGNKTKFWQGPKNVEVTVTLPKGAIVIIPEEVES